MAIAKAVQAEPWRRHVIDRAADGADGVRPRDVNGDGRLDFATGYEEGGIVRAYLHPGPERVRNSWPAVTVGRVPFPEDAVFADLDGDGAVDVISCCEADTRAVFFHWAPANREHYLQAKKWETARVPATWKQSRWMYAMPLVEDATGVRQIVLGSKSPHGQIALLSRGGDARDTATWRLHPLYKAGWIMSLEARDMDKDGDLDILGSDRKGPTRGILWLENPGSLEDNASTWREHRIGGADQEAMFLTSADLDQDGRQDVVAALWDAGLLFLRATVDASRPWQEYHLRLPDTFGLAKAVAVGDLDGDGQRDVAFTCENLHDARKSGVGWLRYEGSPTESRWQIQDISGPGIGKFDRLELLDLDADGDLDLVTCEERANLGVVWYENPLNAPGR